MKRVPQWIADLAAAFVLAYEAIASLLGSYAAFRHPTVRAAFVTWRDARAAV